jgi:ADP-ribose pyrophosphatase YjhB (NUDIX family)
MLQGYKIYFGDRVLILSSKIPKSFEKNSGLFYKYESRLELHELLNVFEKLVHIQTLYIQHEREDELLEKVKSFYTIVEAAGGIVYNNDNQILLIFRRGKWDLPKGKVEKGEFYKQTALREVQEECGLKQIETGKHLFDTYHTYTQDNEKILKRTVWYEMFLKNEETPVPQTAEDITDVKWFDYDSMAEVMKNTYASLKDLLPFLALKSDSL